MPLTSIIVPVYNRSEYLKITLESILNLRGPEWEALVVDDGSSEDIRGVVEQFHDPRLIYHTQAHQGVVHALNRGAEVSRGEFLIFLGSDDLLVPDRLQRHLSCFERDPALGLVASGYQFINSRGELISTPRYDGSRRLPPLGVATFLNSCPFFPPSVTVRRAWGERVGWHDTRLDTGLEDWDLWLRLAHAGCPMIWEPGVVAYYRMHGNNMSGAFADQRKGIFQVLDQFFAAPDLEDDLQALRGQTYANAYLRAAYRDYASNQVALAKEDIAQAIQLNPGLLDQDAAPLFNTLLGYIDHPHAGTDPGAYLERIFHNLPEPLASQPALARRALAYGALRLLAKATFPNRRAILAVCWLALRNQPSLFLKPRFWLPLLSNRLLSFQA